jgi:uncharacterized protein YgiM (DUF1202 family)
MWGAVGALLVIGVLVVVLMQGRDAQSDTTTAAPPASNNTAVEADEEGAGTNVNTSAADDADGAAGVPALPEQPTLTPAPPAQSQPGRDTFVVVNTGTQGLFLRAEPSTNGTILETLRDGTEVEQIGEDDIGANYVWRHVRAPGGQEGWVAVDWLQPAP